MDDPQSYISQYGDVFVDTNKAHAIYKEWLAMTRPAGQVSPDGTRRPYWLLRSFRPAVEAYRLPPEAESK